jgi:type II secretory pathway component PulK
MVTKRITKAAKARGAAIMLALWALFLLSAMIISWALDINTRLTNSGNTSRNLEAVAMACSGAEIALHPGVKPGASVLKGGLGQGQSFEARITGEGGRLNLNRLVAGENPVNLEFLRKYLEIKGVDLNERDHMIDCLLDWIDPDNLVRLNGAEDEPGYQAANKFLTSLDELKRVRGWEEFTARPDWDADFTLNSSTAQIDINWASRDVLLALPGMFEGLVDRIMTMRLGPDGLEGTPDDYKFANPQEVQLALGFSQEQFNQLAALLTYNDPVLRVTSIGKSGTVTRTVRMVINKQVNPPRLISWKEL